MKGVGGFLAVEEPLHHDDWLVAGGWSGRQSLGLKGAATGQLKGKNALPPTASAGFVRLSAAEG